MKKAVSLSLLAAGLLYGLAVAAPLLLPFAPLQSVSHTLLMPFQIVGQTLTQNAKHLYGEAFAYETLRLENEALAQELAMAETMTRDATLALAENERLRSLLSFAEERRDLHFVPANLLSYSSGNWEDSVRLSRGSADGLAPALCVVDALGQFFGIVTEVSTHSAEVFLLTDPGFELGGLISTTEEQGLLSGELSLMQDGLLALSHLPRELEAVVGDPVVSFAPEGLFPSGLLVGHITEIRLHESGMYSIATVQPATSPGTLSQVFVVTDFG